MTLSITDLALVALAGGVGSYFAGYLRKKGENLATHEDIDGLVKQVQAVTTATEQIKAQIASDVWDRQKRWELKREVLFQAAKAVAEADEALRAYNTVVQVKRQEEKVGNPFDYTELVNSAGERWFRASAALDESLLFVGVACGQDARKRLRDFAGAAKGIAANIADDPAIYDDNSKDLIRKFLAVRDSIREELGADTAQPAPK
jgi:hypothetical protein